MTVASCVSFPVLADPAGASDGSAVAQAPAAAGAVTLRGELRELLKSHPSLMASKGRVQVAREEERRAFAGYLPRVEFSGDYGYERVDSPGTRASGTNGGETHEVRRQTTLTVTQNLFEGMGTSRNVDRAASQRKVAEFSLLSIQQNLLLEGIQNYLTVLRQGRLVTLARQNEEILKRQLKLEDERVQRGSGIAVDVLLAKTRVQLAVERRVQLQGGLEDALARYKQVFGHPANPASMQDPALDLPQIDERLDRAIGIAKENNPQLGVTENQIRSAEHTKEAARSGYYPRLDLVGRSNWEKDIDGVQGVRRDWAVMLRATWELFSGFATRAGVSAAAFEQAVAQDEHRNNIRKIVEDLQISLQQLKTARLRVELLQNAVVIAEEVFLSRQRLRDAGRETAINVLDAQSELFAARINHVAASFDARVATFRVLFSTGMLTPETLGL